MNPRFVLFDLDGTLSDSAPGILASLRHAFAATGVAPLPAEVERSLLGPPFYTSLPPHLGDVPLADVIAAYRDHYGAGSMFDTVAYPGVAALLGDLAADGRRLAVATSKPEPHAVHIVEHLGLAPYFETIAGDTFDGARDTKALVIGEVLARLGEPSPADVVMIGDREHDVHGARTHGIDTLGAGWGYGAPAELASAGAVLIAGLPHELRASLGLRDAAPA